jgi:hypothetical protein
LKDDVLDDADEESARADEGISKTSKAVAAKEIL